MCVEILENNSLKNFLFISEASLNDIVSVCFAPPFCTYDLALLRSSIVCFIKSNSSLFKESYKCCINVSLFSTEKCGSLPFLRSCDS